MEPVSVIPLSISRSSLCTHISAFGKDFTFHFPVKSKLSVSYRCDDEFLQIIVDLDS